MLTWAMFPSCHTLQIGDEGIELEGEDVMIVDKNNRRFLYSTLDERDCWLLDRKNDRGARPIICTKSEVYLRHYCMRRFSCRRLQRYSDHVQAFIFQLGHCDSRFG